jgi:hypothetical protein
MSVQIIYNAGSGNVTLTFKRGPLNFKPYWDGRVHDNLATSGAARERVVENLDILISFEMPNMVLSDDLSAWASFEAWALAGGQFTLYPCVTPPVTLTDYYNCLLEDVKWMPARNAPAKYGATVLIRILQDSQCPSGPDIVLRRFYGVSP